MSKHLAKRLLGPFIVILGILLGQVLGRLFQPYFNTIGHLEIGGLSIDWFYVIGMIFSLALLSGISLFLISIINKNMK